MKVYCLLFEGCPVQAHHMKHLTTLASAMCKKGSCKGVAHNDDYAINLTTKFESVTVGTLAGYQFEGVITSAKGEVKLRLLGDPDLLEEVEGAEFIDVEIPRPRQVTITLPNDAPPSQPKKRYRGIPSPSMN